MSATSCKPPQALTVPAALSLSSLSLSCHASLKHTPQYLIRIPFNKITLINSDYYSEIDHSLNPLLYDNGSVCTPLLNISLLFNLTVCVCFSLTLASLFLQSGIREVGKWKLLHWVSPSNLKRFIRALWIVHQTIHSFIISRALASYSDFPLRLQLVAHI